MRLRGLVALMATMAVFTGACGGSGDGSSQTSSESDDAGAVSAADRTQAEGLVDAESQITEEWGDVDGFAVTLLAIDRGYLLDQIVANPTIAADGTIEGVDPAGSASGMFGELTAAAAEGASAHTVPAVHRLAPPGHNDDARPSDAFLAFIDSSAGAMFDAAQRHLAELARQERLAAEFEQSLTLTTLALLTRGYTAEQLTEALFFGTITGPLFPCIGIVDDPPVVPPGEDGFPSCPPLGADPSSTSDPDSTGSAPSTGDDSDPAGESSEGVLFVGTFSGPGDESGDEVLIDRIEMVAGDDLTGTIEVLVQGGLFEDSTQLDCFYLLIELAPGDVPATGEGTYAGTATGRSAFPDGACPGGGPPPLDSPAETIEVVASIEGDTLSGTIGGDSDAANSFTATRAR
ncbi:hypothetical protein [Nocardioides dilutus]